MLMMEGAQPAAACLCKPASEVFACQPKAVQLCLPLPSDTLEALRAHMSIPDAKAYCLVCDSRLLDV